MTFPRPMSCAGALAENIITEISVTYNKDISAEVTSVFINCSRYFLQREYQFTSHTLAITANKTTTFFTITELRGPRRRICYFTPRSDTQPGHANAANPLSATLSVPSHCPEVGPQTTLTFTQQGETSSATRSRSPNTRAVGKCFPTNWPLFPPALRASGLPPRLRHGPVRRVLMLRRRAGTTK